MKKLSKYKLVQTLKEASEMVEVGARYYHYKDSKKTYTVTGIGILEDTEQPAVIYQAEYGQKLTWIRTLSDWMKTHVIRGKTVSKFTKIG